MDRIRDLASRKRASFPARLPSFPITSRNLPFALSQPKADDDDDNDDAKPTTSSASTASEPIKTNIATLPDLGAQSTESAETSQNIVQTETGQAEVQAQFKSTSGTEVSKLKHKKKKKNKKEREDLKGASMEPLEAQMKLFEMADAAIKQNETLASSGLAVSRRMNELARDVLEANQVIERQDREIAEVDETIKLMEAKLKETQKLLNEARLLVSETINGDSAQARRAKTMKLVHKVTSVTRDIKMETISTWSKEKTNKYLKTLQGVYFANQESVMSDIIDAGIRASAKHFLFHGNYDDQWTPMLFHLTNGHDYNAFLDKAREEDREAASAHHVHYETWPIARQHRQESAASKDKQEAGPKIPGAGGDGNGKKGTVKITAIQNLSPGLGETSLERVCHHPGCNCWKFAFVMLVEWLAMLRTAMRCYPGITPEEGKYALFAAVMTIKKQAENVACVVSPLGATNANGMPVISFLYMQNDEFIKHAEVLKKLRNIAGKLGFDFEAWEHDGKAGCRVAHSLKMDGVATERWLELEIVLSKLVEAEIDWCTKDLDAIERNRGEELKIEIRYHAVVFLFEQAEVYMMLLGTTLKACSPAQFREFVERCISSAKLKAGGLLIEHHRRLQEMVPPAKKQPNKQAAQNDKASQEKKSAQEQKSAQKKKPVQEKNASGAK